MRERNKKYHDKKKKKKGKSTGCYSLGNKNKSGKKIEILTDFNDASV